MVEANDEIKIAHVFKILVIGDSGTGKSCILLRLTDERFIKNHLITIGIDYKAKTLLLNDQYIKLQIWDTSGLERFKTITKQYYKNADSVVIVFDLTNRDSFERIQNYIKEVRDFSDKNAKIHVIIGNKSEAENIEVCSNEAESLASEFGSKYFEVSALNNTGIDESFAYIAEQLVKDVKNE